MVCVRKFGLAAGVVAMAAACASGQIAAPFTYQGEFLVDGLRVTGVYDMRFTLHDSPTNTALLTTAVCANDVQVIEGKFAVEIQWSQNDLYPPVGGFRYIQISAREDAGLACSADLPSYTTLSPRTKLTYTPYASSSIKSQSSVTSDNSNRLEGQAGSFYQNASNINAGTLSAARLPATVAQTGTAQTFTAVQSFSGGSASVAPFNVNSTAKVSSLNADLLDGLDSAAFAGVSHTHDASAIVSGVLADARLASNVARRDAANQFTQLQTFGGNLVVVNPTSPLVGLQAGFATDQAFIKIGGLGNGSANGLVFQNFSNATLMKLQDNGDVGIGTATPESRLHVRGAGALGEVIVTPGVSDSTAQLSLFENTTASLGMAMRYNGTTNDMEIFGKNATGDTAAHLRIDRDSGNAVFAGTGGDASVQVPTGSINPAEMLAEPGVSLNGSDFNPILIYTAGNPAPVIAQTEVNAPTAGFVLALGTFTVTNPANVNSDDSVAYYIDLLNPSPGTQVAASPRIGVISCENSGPIYSTSTQVTVQRLFAVQPGVTTMRLRVYDTGNNGRRALGYLSLMFFPTTYVNTANKIENP